MKKNRRAKIVCTLGPSTADEKSIAALIEAGMNVARFNFSHGTHEGHQKTLKCLRGLSKRLNKPVAALMDLQGPKIRIGKFPEGSVKLVAGDSFVIKTGKEFVGDNQSGYTSYAGLTSDVTKGDTILLDDGYLSLKVSDVQKESVHTVVVDGGRLKDNKGINLPNAKVSQPALTAKDKKDLAFGLKLGFDYIALSFVQRPEDVLEAKALASAGPSSIPVICLLYTSPSPRDATLSRMPSSA